MTEEKRVAKWDEELAKHAKAAAANERPQVSRISLRGGVMTYMDQRLAENKIACIILASIKEQTYYAKGFDPNRPDAPDCFAFSETGEDMVPHEKAFDRQHETCTGCPQNEWGSAKQSVSGRGKACKSKRKLLLMPADALNKKTVKTAELATVDIPVTSIAQWSNYVNFLEATEKRPTWAVVTEVQVQPDPRTQIKVTFKMGFPIGDDFLSDILTRVNASKDILLIPYEKTSEGLSKQTEAMQTGKKY